MMGKERLKHGSKSSPLGSILESSIADVHSLFNLKCKEE